MNLKLKEIENLNEKIKKCKKCRLYQTRTNALCGEGNLDAKIMLIAQAPGENEDREGKMFIGPSGKKLDDLLRETGIARKQIYMTNLIKCMLPKYRKPKQDEIQICSEYLNKEIELINPAILSPLGYYSTKYIFEKYGVPLPENKSGWKKIYGRLFLGKDKKIFPLQHPASLLYCDNLDLKEITGNYRKLKILLNDCKWFPVCPMRRFYEKGKMDKKWIELYCKGDWESCVRYKMEEEGKPHPDWMLPDGSIEESLRGV